MSGIGASYPASYRFPDRLEPHDDESLAGLAMRYASLYDFTVPEQLFVRLGGKRRWLATLCSLDAESVEGAAFCGCMHLTPKQGRLMSNWHSDPASMSIYGKQVSLDLTDCSHRQVCTACLRENPYHRAIWLLSGLRCCAVHGTRLMGRCPACLNRLQWRGPGVHVCQHPECYLDLREIHAEAEPEADLQGIVGLARLFHGDVHASGLGFGDVLKGALVLGLTRLNISHGKGTAALVERRTEEMPRILAQGWDALEPWPSAYVAFLDELVAGRETRRVKLGYAKAYGPLARRLFKTKGSWTAPLAAELADHANGRIDVSVKAYTAKKHGSGRSEADRNLSLNEASRVMAVSVDTVKRLARRLEIDVAPVPAGAQRILDAADIKRLIAVQAQDAVNALDASKILGISDVTLSRLVEDGLISQIPASDRIKSRLSFRRADVEALIAAFQLAAGDAPVVDKPGPEHRILGQAGTRDGFGKREIIRLVLAGELRPVAVWRSARGVSRFLFPRKMSGAVSTKLPAGSDTEHRMEST